MLIEYKGNQPDIHEEAYIAPNAVIRGNITVGKGSRILFGAILTDEGGPVIIGEDCVIMEQAVIRGTPKHPAKIGDAVLVGPHSSLSGCILEDEVFIATGSSIFNGVQIKHGSEVRINGVVHVNSVVEADSIVPIGWVAVGNPAQFFPPNKHDEIWALQKEMDFPGTVWGVDRSVSKGERNRRYAEGLKAHKFDEIMHWQK